LLIAKCKLAIEERRKRVEIRGWKRNKRGTEDAEDHD